MKTLIRLAWRNIWRSKRRSLISMASVLFAVLFAISADSFERGSYELMISNLVKFSTGYIQIQDVLYEEEPSINNAMLFDDSLQKVLQEFSGDIDYTIPRIQSFALAATSVKTRGAYLMGIDPELENRFNGLADNLVDGEYFHPNDQSVMLSSGLANILGLEIGDTLALIGQGFQGANASGLYPVKGIIKLSIPEMNNNTIYMPLPAAQYFFDAQDRVTSLIVMPINTSKSGALTDDLNGRLDHEWYTALHWEHMLKDMLRLMEMDSAGSKMIIYILYIVIGFGLFGTILTMMLERM